MCCSYVYGYVLFTYVVRSTWELLFGVLMFIIYVIVVLFYANYDISNLGVIVCLLVACLVVYIIVLVFFLFVVNMFCGYAYVYVLFTSVVRSTREFVV